MVLDSTTHPSLSMLLTHTTYVWAACELTVVRRETTSLLPKRELLVSRKTSSVSTRELVVSLICFQKPGNNFCLDRKRSLIEICWTRRQL